LSQDLSACGYSSLPDWLSCFPEKLKCYAADKYFLEGWATLTDLHHRDVFAWEQLWKLGSVLFKADAMLRGNGIRGIHFLEEHGFQIRAAREVSFSGERVEHFWRYSLGRLSHERVELLKRLQTTSASLYLIVESVGNGSRLPCSLQVTELKGQAEVAKRYAGNLRYAMGDPQSAFFNFVHTADEPSDLVRELGLLFNATERRSLIVEAVSGSRPDAEAVYNALRATCERSDLDFSGAVKRLLSRVALAKVLSDRERAECLDAIGRLHDTGHDSWLRLRDRLCLHGVRIADIEDIVITGGLVALKQPNQKQLFPSCEARHWQNHNPSLECGARLTGKVRGSDP
jgi:nucleoside diphosphate kinase